MRQMSHITNEQNLESDDRYRLQVREIVPSRIHRIAEWEHRLPSGCSRKEQPPKLSPKKRQKAKQRRQTQKPPPNKRFNPTRTGGGFSAYHVGPEIESQSLRAPLVRAG